jgi:hypothetical protein
MMNIQALHLTRPACRLSGMCSSLVRAVQVSLVVRLPMQTYGHIPEVSRYLPDLFALTAATLEPEEVQQRCLSRGWKVVEYRPEDGVARFEMADGLSAVVDSGKQGGIGGRPILHLPLYYWPEDEGPQPSNLDGRGEFDAAFAAARQVTIGCLGEPFGTGTYEYRHRPGWPYSYAVWPGERAFFIILQDEIDIQFGMDVSIWLLGRQEGDPLPSFPLRQGTAELETATARPSKTWWRFW